MEIRAHSRFVHPDDTQNKMLNEENVYFVNGNSEIYVPEENDKDCTDDLDIQDERFNEENDNSEVYQNEENDKSCLIESDIEGNCSD
ncbi:hypothetical protein L2E82_33694 [Cichorium intybus]|uniref:Uncharacterized protein n=1 Tax=Cichorium intybus TaxID=13427 RepID=A0ACB9BKV9_CICIN|nr:hypothetical protein L2E82_33694 [Cichorium intybus]